MLNSKYKLRYLPLFYEDLNEKVEYIAYEKLNPDAALRLIDNVEAILFDRCTNHDLAIRKCKELKIYTD